MKKERNAKPVNFDYLYSIAKSKNKTIIELSQEIGMEKSYISDRKRQGTMYDAHIRLICALYGADYKELTTIPNTSTTSTTPATTDTTIGFILKSLQGLSERVSALESSKQVSVSDKEEIVLLLRQMTKFGQCEEAHFKAKAKSYGFSTELVQFAIENQNCKRDVTAGKVWLIRK